MRDQPQAHKHVPQFKKPVLLVAADEAQHIVSSQQQMKPEQLIRRDIVPLPTHPFARLGSCWHRNLAHQVLLVALAIVVAAVVVFVTLASAAVLQNANSFAEKGTLSPQLPAHHIGATPHASGRPGAGATRLLNVKSLFPCPTGCTPTVQASTPTKGSGTSHSSVAAMIEQVFGPYAQEALRVATCESGLNPNAYNPTSIGGSHAAGIFQILYPRTWMRTSQASRSPYDAMANILAAYEIFTRDGKSWREWSCR